MELETSRATQEPSRIIIAEDHPLLRSAIRQTLEEQPNLEVVADVANGQEAVELCRHLEPELVLMDLRMPHMDGVAATRVIKRELPDTLVLILTAIDESRGLPDSLEAGPAQITHAVRRVLSGDSALDEELAMRLLMSLMDSQSHEEQENHKGGPADSSGAERDLEERGRSHPAPSLTSREVEILRLVVRGQTNQQIGRTLSISVSTVKRHVRHISEKLGVSERVQAAVRAVELGVLDEVSAVVSFVTTVYMRHDLNSAATPHVEEHVFSGVSQLGKRDQPLASSSSSA